MLSGYLHIHVQVLQYMQLDLQQVPLTTVLVNGYSQQLEKHSNINLPLTKSVFH